LYHQLASQKNKWNLENQLNEKKLARKTDRIMNLEKQLHETKDLVGQYKSKIESLKSLISVSNTNNIPMHEIWNENYENNDTIVTNTSQAGGDNKPLDVTADDTKHQEESILRKSFSASTSARIVKFIRGGQSKSISKPFPSTRLNFASMSLPSSENKGNVVIPKSDNKVEPH